MGGIEAGIAIVGASLAGGRAAWALRSEGFDGAITLIGAEPHPPYERPPLSKEVLLGVRPPEDTYLATRVQWDDLAVDLRLGSPVARLKLGERCLELADGTEVIADRVLLCTGTRPRLLPVPGSDDSRVRYLRTIEDAVAIGDRLARDAPVVVIGGGLIGGEVAAAASRRGCAVTIVEMEAMPFRVALGEDVAAHLTRVHREHGVRILTGTRVTRIDPLRSTAGVVLDTGEVLEAAVVVVGIGVLPADDLAAEAGVACGNGILVDARCRTSVPNVFAAGDVANTPSFVLGGRVRVEHWKNAQDQGTFSARSMLDLPGDYRAVPWFWSDQYDVNIQLAGHVVQGAEVAVRGDAESSSFARFFVRDGRLVGALGVNRPRDIRMAMKIMEREGRVDGRALSDEARSLADLLT